MSKHTPEPWVNESPYISGKVKGGRPNGEIIASVRGFVPEAEDFGLSAANTKRIVACVNALAGIEDPQAYLADLRRRIGELEAACRDVLKSVENYFCERKPESEWDEYDAMMAPYWKRLRELMKDSTNAP